EDITPLKTTQVRILPDLEDYLDAWRVLANGTPMHSPEWLLVWWQFYAKPDDELSVLLFHEPEGALVGLAPLYIRIEGKRRIVCLLGSGDASTNHTTWLTAAGWEQRVSKAVAQFLLGLKSGWNCVQLDSIDADNMAVSATVTHMAENGCLVRKIPRHNCWKTVLPSTWEEYLMMLSRSHRKQCRSLHQRYFESGRVRIHTVTSTADFHQGFEILLQLHSARWGDSTKLLGCFSNQMFREFHETVALELLKRNQLLLVWLEYDGKPIAVEYQFIDKRAVYSYLAGMDPSVTEFPPGNLSIMASIQAAITHGCETFDLSRGDQPYKAHWRATPTACHDVLLWPEHIPGRLNHAMCGMCTLAEYGKKQAVKWVKVRTPQHFIDVWRRLRYTMTGKRKSPRKAGTPD
ncbi:MAG: GNAT family N-acetyltransferase, partial [Desulfuromonadaceae bacterium]|nr:GNAT family N-acetyltransferase [Desulfuromonadaceae bacterium]